MNKRIFCGNVSGALEYIVSGILQATDHRNLKECYVSIQYRKQEDWTDTYHSVGTAPDIKGFSLSSEHIMLPIGDLQKIIQNQIEICSRETLFREAEAELHTITLIYDDPD
jgi:hypothetical protein